MPKVDQELALRAVSDDLDALHAEAATLSGQIAALEGLVIDTSQDVKSILAMLTDKVGPALDKMRELDGLRARIARLEAHT